MLHNHRFPQIVQDKLVLNTPVILIITRFLLVEVTVKNDFLKGIQRTFKQRIGTEISSEVIAYVEQ